MIETSLAHSAQESMTRVERGRQLFEERGNEFRHEKGAWLVPSEKRCGDFYAVRLSPAESCECADFEYRGEPCEHICAARIAHTKSGTCSCCGHRVLNRFLSEVEEYHQLLTWFVGDLICAECIRAGYWC